MNTEISGVIFMYVLTVALAIPLGRYIGKVFEGDKTRADRLFNPIDRAFFKLGGIDPKKRNELETAPGCFAHDQPRLVPALHVRTDEYELAAA